MFTDPRRALSTPDAVPSIPNCEEYPRVVR
jgi:hypothetical protein